MENGKSNLDDDLTRQLLTMQLDPDEVLDNVGLSERYGLSRAPLQDLFRRLTVKNSKPQHLIDLHQAQQRFRQAIEV